MSQNMFRSEVELGKFLGSIDVPSHAFHAITETSTPYELRTSPSGIQVLAFNCSADYTSRFLKKEFDLVSSKNNQSVDFIPTEEVNSSFSINKAAVELFEHLPDDLKQLKKELISRPSVITGRGLDGYCAILFALWLHHGIDMEKSNDESAFKRPICITFGSPLVGNEALLHIISAERPQWKSGFLNVVAMKDRFASFFASNSGYQPFGTFLFCTESGGHSAFEDQDSILAVLDSMGPSTGETMDEVHDYGNIFSAIKMKALNSMDSELGEFNLNSLRAGIILQFKEVGMLDGNLIDKMEKNQVTRKKMNVYEPAQKLNDIKRDLSHMEWYMKIWKSEGGYYNCYKKPKTRDQEMSKDGIMRHKRQLNQYWEEFVKETERKPQLEDAKMRKRWLYSAQNYRRIVEPLDIAEFYTKPGNRNYIAFRSNNHYKKLEDLITKYKKTLNPSEGKRSEAASLTEDSCFWARVEESLISLNELWNGGSSNNATDIEQELKCFEDYVMDAIDDYSVSTEIFINGCSFMEWWAKYKAYKGSSYASELAQYMNNGSYNLYE